MKLRSLGLLVLMCLTGVASFRLATARSPAPSQARALARQIHRARVEASVYTFAMHHPNPDSKSVRTATLVTPSLLLTDSANLLGLPTIVIVTDPRGRPHRTRTVGIDHRSRLAGLQLIDDKDKVKELRAGIARNKVISEGAFALTCGRGEAPRGIAYGTFGIISARSRFAGRVVQISSPLNVGLAGGPVVDLEGKAYGLSIVLPHRVSEDSGVGFMIPWSLIETSLDWIASGKDAHPATLGILVPQKDVEGMKGLPIVEVRPDGPAHKAGLKKGDVLLALGDRPLHKIEDLSLGLSRLIAGQKIALKLRRGSETPFSAVLTTSRRDFKGGSHEGD